MNNYSQMVADLIKPGEDIIATLTPENANILHMAVGLVGEAGELLEHFCANEIVAATIPDSEMIEEFGDAEFYFEGLCQSMQVVVELSSTRSYDPLCIPRYVVATTDMLDLVKKMVVYNKAINVTVFVNTLTNVRICLDRAYDYYGLTQAEALEHNMNKLLKGDTARYKEGVYSDEAAQARRDKQKVKYGIGEADGKGGYSMWAGPTTNLEVLKEQYDGRTEHSYIIVFTEGKGRPIAYWNIASHRWEEREKHVE